MARALAILRLSVKIVLVAGTALMAGLLLASVWFELPSRATPDERQLIDAMVRDLRRGVRAAQPTLCIDKLTARGDNGGSAYAQNWSSERYSSAELQDLLAGSAAKDIRLIVDRTALPPQWIDSLWSAQCERRVQIGRPQFNRDFAFVKTRSDLSLPTSHDVLRQTVATFYAWRKGARGWERVAVNSQWVRPIT
jgi:hypothetical protein